MKHFGKLLLKFHLVLVLALGAPAVWADIGYIYIKNNGRGVNVCVNGEIQGAHPGGGETLFIPREGFAGFSSWTDSGGRFHPEDVQGGWDSGRKARIQVSGTGKDNKPYYWESDLPDQKEVWVYLDGEPAPTDLDIERAGKLNRNDNGSCPKVMNAGTGAIVGMSSGIAYGRYSTELKSNLLENTLTVMRCDAAEWPKRHIPVPIDSVCMIFKSTRDGTYEDGSPVRSRYVTHLVVSPIGDGRYKCHKSYGEWSPTHYKEPNDEADTSCKPSEIIFEPTGQIRAKEPTWDPEWTPETYNKDSGNSH